MFLGLAEIMWELIASFIVAGVLIATFLKELRYKQNQTKMDYIRFYNELDTKLRDTDKELRKEVVSDAEKYHYMVQIIITVMHVIKFHDALNPRFQNRFSTKFDLEYFRGWIRLGYAFTDYLYRPTGLDKDDVAIARKLRTWCGEKYQEEENKKHPIDWTMKDGHELPPRVLVTKKTVVKKINEEEVEKKVEKINWKYLSDDEIVSQSIHKTVT